MSWFDTKFYEIHQFDFMKKSAEMKTLQKFDGCERKVAAVEA